MICDLLSWLALKLKTPKKEYFEKNVENEEKWLNINGI